MVSQALAFYRELNQHRRSFAAQKLPAGSEACFSLADHLQCVDRRLHRCESWKPATDLDRQALSFVHEEVMPRWRQLRAATEAEAAQLGLGLNDVVPVEARRLSPSDFGFHNALLDKSGTLRFVDFEYAGWDDPAKLACDFFCQPAVLVPSRFQEPFVAEIVADLLEPQKERRRIELLMPVYRVKWLTILLNDFQPAGDGRRRFARPEQDAEQRKAQQLGMARERLPSAFAR